MKRILLGIAIAIAITVFLIMKYPVASTKSTPAALQTGNAPTPAKIAATNQVERVMVDSRREPSTPAVTRLSPGSATTGSVVQSSSGSAGVEGANQGVNEPDAMSLLGADFNSDEEFASLEEALRIAGTAERAQRQQKYEAHFAKHPLVVQGNVRVEELLCGRQVCIGSVSGNQQTDLDAFFAGVTRATPGDPRIYALSATLLENRTGAVRRFAFSTDPNLREVPFKGELSK